MDEIKTYWFLGAKFKGNKDQTENFISSGIWQNGYDNKLLDNVKSISVGDKVAIKSTYNQKINLPFDNKGLFVSVMEIKAIGIVTKNQGDGKLLEVDWQQTNLNKKWYFYTYINTIWSVKNDNWLNKQLINFAFYDQPQDIDAFRNAPYWKSRYGDNNDNNKPLLEWIPFYEEIADKLLSYQDKNKRLKLMTFINQLALEFKLSYLIDKNLHDICPFTVLGTFNRGNAEEIRKNIAQKWAEFFDVKEPVPNSWEGIPLLNNQISWFFTNSENQQQEIDNLWDLYSVALNFSNIDDNYQEDFKQKFDLVMAQPYCSWQLTNGLFWIRPNAYLVLDKVTKSYLSQYVEIFKNKNLRKSDFSGNDYLKLLDDLTVRFADENFPVHSYPELYLTALRNNENAILDTDYEAKERLNNQDTTEPLIIKQPYTLDDLINEGCFVDEQQLQAILKSLKLKKNIILQGPPGTGKTWLAKRLANIIVGYKDSKNIKAIQFHPNMSYEDFIRGYRPTSDGKLSLTDGPFLEIINQARNDAQSNYVIVIEEINRGNPAQIFGEMLTLLEADKRNPNEALELTYQHQNEKGVFIPANLYVIGTMNIADRSLAMLDFALRRRFAFYHLSPHFGENWLNYMQEKHAFSPQQLQDIKRRIEALNQYISNDSSLGKAFTIGHSYFTCSNQKMTAQDWFKHIVRSEIEPLLEEYWFGEPEKFSDAMNILLGNGQ
ncbi:hypothetical protein A9G22_05980 [Gilliamella sp. App2-1]|uniref:AAA family ATPase n=1 Tax=Gilliamella sp. App2-1 TaxID=3120230 RepID=UPI000827B9E7|nr:AAA family ATPase [Gilliamella apicola]OCG23591.1 hypothetical protein A9G22_05980 [Gilliamella apicola]